MTCMVIGEMQVWCTMITNSALDQPELLKSNDFRRRIDDKACYQLYLPVFQYKYRCDIGS